MVEALVSFVRSSGRTYIMNTATLVKWVRDPRSGEVHLPSEEVTIVGLLRNMDRTVMKVRWQAGGNACCFRRSSRKAVRTYKADRADRLIGVPV
jgi:hypothetical protein